MRREGGVVRLRDPGCFVVFVLPEGSPAAGPSILDSVGGGRVCAVFVVASCVADSVIIDTAISGAVVVWIAVDGWGWGCGKLRTRLGCYEEVRDTTGLLPIILTISVGGSRTFCRYASASVSSSNSRSLSLFA